MSRMVGTVSRGIRTPIIRSGDDLVEIVTGLSTSLPMAVAVILSPTLTWNWPLTAPAAMK